MLRSELRNSAGGAQEASTSRRRVLTVMGGSVAGAMLAPAIPALAAPPPPSFPPLFRGKETYAAFANIKSIVPVRRMAASAKPFHFPEGRKVQLPPSYVHAGETKSLPKLIEETRTGGLLVLKDGQVRYENYWLTGGRDVQWISFSVAKSFTSALVGIALSEGHIKSLNDPIDRYVPWLSRGAYKGVRIVDVLHMSSGASYKESYELAGDPNSDFAKGSAAAAAGKTREWVSTTPRAFEPGTQCNYNSNDTQTLGWLLQAATGRTLTEYMQEKLCEPLGMQHPGYWMHNTEADEAAAYGLNLTARDFAKLGELYRNGGVWNGRQVVPADYVKDSVKIAAPWLAPGQVNVGSHKFGLGYGYQWWIPEPGKDFSAIGIYNQYVYVNPGHGTVIVKQSANPRYGLSTLDSDNRDEETISALQAISRTLA